MTNPIPEPEWGSQLQRLTQRNAGRLTILSELEADLGAQESARGYPLRGIAYDRRAGRIDIMLGDLNGADHHLTRGINDVLALDIWSAADGRDLAVRIERSSGETILQFEENISRRPLRSQSSR